MQENRDTDAAATSATGANGGGLQGVWKQARDRLRARARLRRQQAMRARNLRLKYATPEQLAYADLLDFGIRIGRYLLAATFILYVFGITPAKIPLSDLPSYWSMAANQYSKLVGVGTGWDWLDFNRLWRLHELPRHRLSMRSDHCRVICASYRSRCDARILCQVPYSCLK